MLKLNQVLMPVDLSKPSCDALRHGAMLAARWGARITLLYVRNPGRAGVVSSRGDLGAHVVELMGDPARTIVEFADTLKPDLIMMSTHCYGPLRRLLRGSVTAKVLQEAAAPVWTIACTPGLAPPPVRSPQRIICAVDRVSPASGALRWASRLAKEFQAALTILHVIESLDPRTYTYYLSPEWRRQEIASARLAVKKMAAAAKVDAEIWVERGPVALTVPDVAREIGADLLVIGRAGRKHAVDGRLTNAYAMIRESPCPVLSVDDCDASDMDAEERWEDSGRASTSPALRAL